MSNRMRTLLGSVVIAACLTGCESDNKPKITSQALEARMLAARNVSDPAQRDLALQATALDAARAQRVESTRRAISDIADPRLRDETASQTARMFHNNELYGQARELANMINDQQ